MSFNLLFNKANNLYLNGAYTEAEKVYRQILAFAPENSDTLNMLGLIASAKNEHNIAISYFYEALKNAQNPLPIYFNLAVSLTHLQKYDEAIEAYENVIKVAPKTKEAYNNLGGIYEKLENKTQATESYKKAIEIDENYIDALVNLAVLNKDTKEIKNIAEKFKTSPLPLYYLACFAFDQENFEQALSYAIQANELQEAYDIKNLVAQIYLKLDNKENAQKYFHQALILNPQSIDASVNLGVLEQDESYFKKALSLNPQSFEAHISYADFLYHENRKPEALEEYHQALFINPDNPALSNNIALVLKDMQDYKGALDLLLNAFLKDPQNKNISVNMAETLVLLHEKEPDEALKIAKLWQKNAPNNVFAERTVAAFENNTVSDDMAYAQNLFDEFAPLYDKQMESIKYNIFNKINELNLKIEGHILDLGCGTGLAAEKLKTSNANWIGVDISKKMLKSAQEKNLYKTLIESDILSFLESSKIKYSFILLLDVIEYTKDFEKILNLCFPSHLLLSIEKAPKEIKTYALAPTGRYQHNPEYIENLLKTIGYKNIQTHNLPLRTENGKDVDGILFVAEA